MPKSSNSDKLTVIALAPHTRSKRDDDEAVRGEAGEMLRSRWKVVEKQIDTRELTSQVNVLLAQIEAVLKNTNPTVGSFHFCEFEISAGVTATGKLALFTVFGAEAGVSGGLKFVFRRSPSD